MKKFLLSLVALATATAAPAQTVKPGPLGYPVRVLSVTDGDTVVFDSAGWSPFAGLTWKVRVRGIDTPEKRSACVAERDAAKRATEYTTKLVNLSKRQLFLQKPKHDKFGGRFDAVVVLPVGQRSLGDSLVAAGLARVYTGGKRLPWCDSMGRFTP